MHMVKNMGNETLYVAFPRVVFGDAKMPPELRQWLNENKISYNPGVCNGYDSGIFLQGADAIAYKLKFGL